MKRIRLTSDIAANARRLRRPLQNSRVRKRIHTVARCFICFVRVDTRWGSAAQERKTRLVPSLSTAAPTKKTARLKIRGTLQATHKTAICGVGVSARINIFWICSFLVGRHCVATALETKKTPKIQFLSVWASSTRANVYCNEEWDVMYFSPVVTSSAQLRQKLVAKFWV